MAQSSTPRRFYIDIDSSDDHTVVRRVPVHKGNWVAVDVPATLPATPPANPHSHISPRRLGLMLQTMRKRQGHS